MAGSNSEHRHHAPQPAAFDKRDDFQVQVGDVIRSKFGLTTRTVVAVQDGTVILVGKTGTTQSISTADAARYWYRMDTGKR